MQFDIISLFPGIIKSTLSESILKRAIENKFIEVNFHNPRDYSKNKHKKVDDVPFGGGGGMLMMCQPLFDCIENIKKNNKGIVIYLSATGDTWQQELCENFANEHTQIILICGHYEGIDKRVIDTFVDKEISIGDYVLTGGEIPAAVLIDSITRLIPGVIESHSTENESFSKNFNRKKEHPHYTRPAEFRGLKVPDVLLSGNHAEIEKWKEKNLN